MEENNLRDGGGGDIEDEIEQEKAALHAIANKDESERRFQVIESGIQNVLFIRTTVQDPVDLVSEILKEISKTQVQRTRHLIRLIPVQKTCKAFETPGAIISNHLEISYNKNCLKLVASFGMTTLICYL